jgi:hypothetical protein
LKLLNALVKEGRTHRLAVFLAGCLHYIHQIANQKQNGNPTAEKFSEITDSLINDYNEDAHTELEKSLKSLLSDANVKFIRTNSRGNRYSIINNADKPFVSHCITSRCRFHTLQKYRLYGLRLNATVLLST